MPPLRHALIALFIAAPACAAPLNLSLTCANGNPYWLPSTTHPPVFGVVIKFLAKADARQRIENTELRNGAAIDPAYTNNQRVIVEGSPGQKWVVLVPSGMIVHVGDPVSFSPGHADPGNLCLYTPNLILP